MRAPELPGIPPRTRGPYVKRAHVVDAGNSDQADFPYAAMFHCDRCAWKSDWWVFDNHAEISRGVPCPNCNTSNPNEAPCT